MENPWRVQVYSCSNPLKPVQHLVEPRKNAEHIDKAVKQSERTEKTSRPFLSSGLGLNILGFRVSGLLT